MLKIRTVLFFFLTISVASNASVKPNFQLTGNKRAPIDPNNVQVLMLFPENTEIIGLMSDCSTLSTYEDFISAFKIAAAKNGANCIVVKKTLGTNESFQEEGLCVEASAIYLKQVHQNKSESADANCIQYLKDIVRLQKTIDSLKAIIENSKTK